MARRKNAIPSVEVKIQVPTDLFARMKLELFSELEGKVPYGVQSEFINGLIREHYRQRDAHHPEQSLLGLDMQADVTTEVPVTTEAVNQ